MGKSAAERSREWRARNPRPDDVHRALASELLHVIECLTPPRVTVPTLDDIRHGAAEESLQVLHQEGGKRRPIEHDEALAVIDRYIAKGSFI